jgi:WD40 repeat protein
MFAVVTAVLAQLGAVAITAAAAATSSARWPWGMDVIRRHPFWSATALTVVLVLLAVLWVLLRGLGSTAYEGPLPGALAPPPEWVVARPEHVDQIVRGLRRGIDAIVGITTGLRGAGGFGRTTLVSMVCADRRVRELFGDQMYLVTMGRDVRGPVAIAARVCDVISALTRDGSTFDDPVSAGAHLGRLLDRREQRVLLVLDDVWEAEQLEPFLQGGRRCARLVVTRVPSVLPADAVQVVVDRMSPAQARSVLTRGLPPLPDAVVDRLVVVTARWPLLLRLTNRAIHHQLAAHRDVTDILLRLQARGPGEAPAVVDDAEQRARAVRSAVDVSTGLLPAESAARFLELGIFAENETVPISLIAVLWRATGGLDDNDTRRLCRQLADLALVTLPDPITSTTPAGESGWASLHDVVRADLRQQLGPRLAEVNGAFLDACAARLPAADPTADHNHQDTGNGTGDGEAGTATAWWEVTQRYLSDHLIRHFLDAGRVLDAHAVATDLRWVLARLHRFGPAAPLADLAVVNAPTSELVRSFHLLTPTAPAHALAGILLSRLQDTPSWGPQARNLQQRATHPVLTNRWPRPDLTDPALRQVLAGHTDWVRGVAVAPDGTWLASVGDDATLRIWDAATGQHRVLTGHTGPVSGVAVAPDGTWLATTSDDTTVRVWNAATGQHRTLVGHSEPVSGVVIAPDGTWLATAGDDGTVRIWDAITGRHRTAPLDGHLGPVREVVIAPDGTWLASVGYNATVRIWDAVTGEHRLTLDGHTGPVNRVAVAPDATWLATASNDRTVRIWEAATGRHRVTLTGHDEWVTGLAIAPNGAWIATLSDDNTVRVWDVATGEHRRTLSGHTDWLRGLAVAPDGTWLATVSDDNTARVWDLATGGHRTLTGHVGPVSAVAVAPDGAWLATVGDDRTVRIWATRPGSARVTVVGHHARAVTSLMVAPDGSWFATTSDDNTVRIWDTDNGRHLTTLAGHTRPVNAVAVAPDGSWLVSAGQDGTVRVWDPTTGRPITTLTGHVGPATGVVVAPDGTWLAGVGEDGTVQVWDTTTGQHRAIPTGHTGPVRGMVIAPDGAWLATAGDDGTVRIWDTITGHHRTTRLAGHGHPVRGVVIAPDGTWLVTVADATTVRIWDAITGGLRATLTGHTEWVTGVAIAEDGPWLATTSYDRTVRIWDVRTGACLTVMRTDGATRVCSWTPDGGGLVVAGEAGLYMFTFTPNSAAHD